jgi:hypothetical protein
MHHLKDVKHGETNNWRKNYVEKTNGESIMEKTLLNAYIYKRYISL